MSHKAKTHKSVHKRRAMKRNLSILARAIGKSVQKKAQITMAVIQNRAIIRSKRAYDKTVKANITKARTEATRRG